MQHLAPLFFLIARTPTSIPLCFFSVLVCILTQYNKRTILPASSLPPLPNSTNAHFDSVSLHLSARLTHPCFSMRACTRPPRFRFASSRCSFAFSHNITKGRFSLQAGLIVLPLYYALIAYSSMFASFFAWSAAMQASMISWMSPFMILSSLYNVRPIR